jgi:hypothetical protein
MKGKGVGLWEFNATFNNISVMSLVVSLITEEHRSTKRKQLTFRKSPTNFVHNVLLSTWCLNGIQTYNLVAIGTDCTGCFKEKHIIDYIT